MQLLREEAEEIRARIELHKLRIEEHLLLREYKESVTPKVTNDHEAKLKQKQEEFETLEMEYKIGLTKVRVMELTDIKKAKVPEFNKDSNSRPF